LTETWLKPNDYITLNESTPHDYSYKHEPCLKGKVISPNPLIRGPVPSVPVVHIHARRPELNRY